MTDQYGDLFNDFSADDFAVKVDVKTIANVKVEADKAKAKVNIKLQLQQLIK